MEANNVETSEFVVKRYFFRLGPKGSQIKTSCLSSLKLLAVSKDSSLYWRNVSEGGTVSETKVLPSHDIKGLIDSLAEVEGFEVISYPSEC